MAKETVFPKDWSNEDQDKLREEFGKKKHIKLRKGDLHNFEMLRSAAGCNDIALVSSRRKKDGTDVALVCAMQRNNDETITPIPLAVMIEGNPFEDFEDPTK